jgi:hypothetical protein
MTGVVMSTWALRTELRSVAPADPTAQRLVAALTDEAKARQADVDVSVAEGERPVPDILEGGTFQMVGLDPHDRMTEADGWYRSAGYRETGESHSNPSANRWFDKALVRLVRGFT